MNTEIRESLDRAKSRALAWTPGDDGATWQMGVSLVLGLYEHAIHEMECAGCEVKGDPKDDDAMLAKLEDMVKDGEICITLCDHLEHANNLKGFTLDKTRYSIRFADETKDSVRVIIEPNDRPRD
jgi:hypothetical protein